MMSKHIGILGHKVSDRVTGLSGVATSVSFDLYGCVQVWVNRGMGKDDRPLDGGWYDIARLEVESRVPAMSAPDYLDAGSPVSQGRKGPEMKGVPRD